MDHFLLGWLGVTHAAPVSQLSEGWAGLASLTHLAVSADYWLGLCGSRLIYHFPEDQTGLLHRMVTSGAKNVKTDISSQVLGRLSFHTCSSSLLPCSVGQSNSQGQHRLQEVEKLESTSFGSQCGNATLQQGRGPGRNDLLVVLLSNLRDELE